MKKRNNLLLGVVMILFSMTNQSVYAAPIDSLTAMQAANHFFGRSSKSVQSKIDLGVKMIKMKKSEKNQVPYLYFLENENGKGWIILSGDNRIKPVIAYSETDSFTDKENPNFNWWMNGIMSEMEAILKEPQSKQMTPAMSEWESLLSAPLVKDRRRNPTKSGYTPGNYLVTCLWDQEGNFAKYTPDDDPTGCVATATGQVLYYWGQKNQITSLKGKGSYEYYDGGYNFPPGVLRSVDYSTKMYNLYAMPATIGNDSVAQLLFDIGIGLRMTYGTGGSGALTEMVPSLLYCHFGFQPSQYVQRTDVPVDSVWTNMLKNEINAGRPVVYGGFNMLREGHCFVVDGYDAAGNFHFNWGWSGQLNGFYVISLQTNNITIGFSHDQDAVIGIQPYALGQSLGYEITNVQFYTQNETTNCDDLNKYIDSSYTSFNVSYTLTNHTNKTQVIPLSFSFYSNASDGGIYADQSSLYYDTIAPHAVLNQNVDLSDLKGVFSQLESGNVNIDLGIHISGNSFVDIGRNSHVVTKDSVLTCGLSPILISDIRYKIDAKIEISWEIPDFQSIDTLGVIKLYSDKNGGTMIDSVLPSASGQFLLDFVENRSYFEKNFYLIHSAAGYTSKKSPDYLLASYPQVDSIQALINGNSVQLNWYLTPSSNGSDEVTGDVFDIQCYDNPAFMGSPIWSVSFPYQSQKYSYSLAYNFSQFSTPYVYYRIRRSFTENVWGWTTMVAQTTAATGFVNPDTILYVIKKGKGTGDGFSWENALGEVSEALVKAAHCNSIKADSIKQIWVAQGTYFPQQKAGNGTLIQNNTFVMLQDVKIYGGFGGYESSPDARKWGNNVSTLSGINATDTVYHVVLSIGNVGSACLDGFTITGGNAKGIDSITVNSRVVADSNGAGLYIQNSSPLINNVIISGNMARSFGGGVYCSQNANPQLTYVSLLNNSASQGGGIFNIQSSPLILNAQITGNSGMIGGGIGNRDNSSPVLVNVALVKNFASNEGGGVYNGNNSTPTFTNNTISGNTAANSGGAVYNDKATPLFQNSIIWGNTSTANVNNNVGNTNNSTPNYAYCLVQDTNLTTSNGLDGTSLTVNPLFVDTSTSHYYVVENSPTIDAGNNAFYNSGINGNTDLRGNLRIYNDTIDMGAYEWILPSDAFLQSLTVSSGTLSPGFNPDSMSYTVNVLNNVHSIILDAIPNNKGSQVSGIGRVTINSGVNTFYITVTSADNSSQNVYTVTITREIVQLSSDATLSGLNISSGILTPAFQPNTYDYTVNVDNSVSTVTVQAVANHVGATVEGSGSKPLMIGSNTKLITVIAEDAVSQQVYTITVTRQTVMLSSDAALQNLVLSAGTLTPPFHVDTLHYTVQVAYNDSTIAINPAAKNSGAIVTISPVTAKKSAAALPLAVGNNTFNIIVTAQDGTMKTYSLVVNRPASSSIENAVSGKDIKVYPNPTTTLVYIETDDGVIPSVNIFDAGGKMILQTKSHQIDFSGYAKGVYFLHIGEKVVKVVKN